MPELTPGVASALSPLVRRIVADAGGEAGPNTYLVGIDEVAVIDPGPADESHLEAVLGCGGDRIRWVVWTGPPQRESVASADALRRRTGAELVAFVGDGVAEADREIGDGDVVEATEFRLTALAVPGARPGDRCYVLEEESLLFSGDVLGARPDDQVAYVATLERLRGLRLKAIAPGFGDRLDDARAALDAALQAQRPA